MSHQRSRKRIFVLFLVIMALTMSACAAPVVAPDVAPDASEPSDTLVVAINGQPARLLPSMAVGRINEIINTMIFESLTTHDADGQLVGLLAESFTNIDDTTWEFKLRDGVKFSNGEPMTAEDVRFTYEELILGNELSPHRTFMNTIESIEVVDDTTLHITTKQPDVILPLRVFDITGSVISKEHFESVGADDYDAQPVGTGPYKLVEFVPDSHISFTANEHYWGETPAYQNLELRFIPDDAARVAAILAGEVDLVSNVSPPRVDEIEANPELEIRRAPGTRAHYIVMDSTQPPFDDVRVRMAVSHAIDREGLVSAIQRGYGTPLAGIFIPQTFGFDPSVQPEYNVEKAKELLAEAGYPDGFAVEFDTFTGSITDHSRVAEAIVGMLEEVGIEASLNVADIATWGPQRLANATNAIYNYSFGDAYFDHGPNLKTFISGAQGYYYSGDEELEALIDEALASFDEEERSALYSEIIGQFYEKGILTGLYRMDQIWAAGSDVDYTPQSDEMYRFFLAKPQ